MNYTTIEQSKKLVELGLNFDTADMYWKKNPILNSEKKWIPRIINKLLIPFDDEDTIPCWSLGALLEVMPTQIEEVKGHKVDLILGHPKNKWCLAYFDWTGLQHGHDTTGDSPFEAVYNMVVWLLENGYIKKKE